MFFGGYERWMLQFWMLRKLDATLLDASILTPYDAGLHSASVLQRPALRLVWSHHDQCH